MEYLDKYSKTIFSKRISRLLFIGIIVVTFFFYLQTALGFMDPDFGWHIRFGELVLQRGIPITDPFSYSMPSYKFINHEWLTDIVLSIIYNPERLLLLGFIFITISIFSVLLHFHSLPVNPWTILLFICTTFSLRMFIGIRPQLLSWFFFSLVWYLLYNQQLWRTSRYLIPLLFLLWANLHGGFPMGLALIFLFSFVGFVTKKPEWKSNSIIFLLSFGATYINPYGLDLWKEIFVSVFDTSLRWSIQEWLPSLATANLILWAYVAGSSIIVFMQYKKLSFEMIVLYVFFLVAALSSVRHLPFWIFISIPVTAKASSYFYKHVKKTRGGEQRLQTAYVFVVILMLVLYILHKLINQYSIPKIDEVYYYPFSAVRYLRSNIPKGNLFSFYGWGGYLIWKLPEKKVFVDGRMPSWKQQPLPDESPNAFKEHNAIFEGSYPVSKAIKKYNISTFLLPVEKKTRKRVKLLERFFTSAKETPDIYDQLRKLKWKIVYKDSIAVVYEVSQ